MNRYLIFDSSCSLCTKMARTICNEAEEWIHEAVGAHDKRAKEWLSQAGVIELKGPALIEVANGAVSALTGARLRWRLLRILGSARTLRLSRVLAGDLTEARHGGPSKLDRRRFVTLLTSIAAGISVVTGFGLSRFSSAAREAKRAQARSGDLFNPGWTRALDYESSAKVLAAEERLRAWERFIHSANIKTLLSSEDFQRYRTASLVQDALYGGKMPASVDEIEKLVADAGGASQERLSELNALVNATPLFECTERSIRGGATFRVLMLNVGRTMLRGLEYEKGSLAATSDLTLFDSDDVRNVFSVHAALRNGKFILKQDDAFSPARPSMRAASEIVGGGVKSV